MEVKPVLINLWNNLHVCGYNVYQDGKLKEFYRDFDNEVFGKREAQRYAELLVLRHNISGLLGNKKPTTIYYNKV